MARYTYPPDPHRGSYSGFDLLLYDLVGVTHDLSDGGAGHAYEQLQRMSHHDLWHLRQDLELLSSHVSLALPWSYRPPMHCGECCDQQSGQKPTATNRCRC